MISNNRSWCGVIGVGVVVISTSLAIADTFFVDPTAGSDSYTGLCETWDGADCGPKLTINAAMSAAADGDEVVLLAGTYAGDGNRDLDFGGKALTVRSTDPTDPDVVAATVIDCQATESDRHRAFKLVNGETLSTQILGLTITNGVAPKHRYDSWYIPLGGAIVCDGASVTLRFCVLQQCTALAGGAVYARGGDVLVGDCVFQVDAATTYRSSGTDFQGTGGAIDFEGASCSIERCSFVRCTATGGGGGVSIDDGYAEVTDCLFQENSTINTLRFYFDGRGGAIFGLAFDGLTIDRCTFVGNSSDHRDNSGEGGAIYADGAQVVIANSVFDTNRGKANKGAIWMAATTSATISGSTLVRNSSPAISRGGSNKIGVTNSILWANDEPVLSLASFVISYSDVQQGADGTGNVNTDPLFVDESGGDLHLQVDSPCIDTGDPDVPPSDGGRDLDGVRRVWNQRVDMGAYEFRSFAYGDMNCDATIDFNDIDPFVLALIGQAEYHDQYPDCDALNADIDGDGTPSFNDIDPFVGLLTR